VVAAVAAARTGGALPAGWDTWAPTALAGADQVVLLVLDGLGSRQLAARAAQAPTLSGAPPVAITSVAPSTTACALTSLATGRAPAVHGLLGYRMAVDGGILNVLRWLHEGADARRSLPARSIQPYDAFPVLAATDRPVPVVSRADFAATGFTAAHLGPSDLRGYHTPSGLAVEVRRALADGAPFVYAYYDGLDRTSHAHGLDEHYDAELAACDRLVGDLLDQLGPGVGLAVTADHGQVEVGRRTEVLEGDLMDGVALLSGEGRFRWLHARPGAAEDVAAAAGATYGDVAWVATREQVIDEGWLGGEPVPAALDRLGDVVLAPFEPTAFMDPADTKELLMVGRHGSLTEDEMWVPLLAWAPR
jgi:hypothetical protein